MTDPTSATPPAISRVRAVIYARGADTREENDAIARCENWADRHDWTVIAVIRETSDAEAPLDRTGIRAMLNHLYTDPHAVALAASSVHISDDATGFHEVCSEAERSGRFLHVLTDTQGDPEMSRRSTADRLRRDALHDVPFDAPRITEHRATTDRRRLYLEGLARVIETATSFRTQLNQTSPADPPILNVVNPSPGGISEAIACDVRDGKWSYIWSWGDRISTTDDVETAGTAIRHVLTPRM
jgi:hypothetical protein